MGHPVVTRRRRLSASSFVTETIAEITDLAEDGRGIARIDGKVTFVEGALPGELVRLRVTHRRRNIDSAETIDVVRASKNRTTPRCRYFGRCGGCSLQHLTPIGQVEIKQAQALSALERIGGVIPEHVEDPLTGPVWGYRRRARLSVTGRSNRQNDDGCSVRVGFHERRRAVTMNLDRCEVLDQRIGANIAKLASILSSLDIHERIPQVEVAASDDRVVLVLRVLQPPTSEDRQKLSAYENEQELSIYLQSQGNGSLEPLTEPSAVPLNYSPDDSLLSLEFGPTDFVQVNGTAGQAMVRQSMDWLDATPDDHVLDLFAGLGNFSLPLAASGAHVTAVDGDPHLVRRGQANARRNDLSIDFIEADLLENRTQAPWGCRRVDLVLLDPPRVGACEAVHHLARANPRRILYISCHAGSLARDARVLVSEYGFHLSRFGIVDMFPHTVHVESMALFEAR